LKAFSTEILGIVFQMFFREGLLAGVVPFLFQHVPVGVDVRLSLALYRGRLRTEGAGLCQ
jgi:hypothetical protein